MAKTVEDFNKRRLRSSNITVVVSIALVLFLLGLMGLILINAQKYSDYIKEQLVVNAYFDENFDAKDSVKIVKQENDAFKKIQNLAPVKRATYISRQMAADEAIKQIKATPGIMDVKNNSTLMVEVYNNLNNILKWILGFSILFLILAVVLINNSIRLKIFSKRFIIKTMQLVGAKRRFILKPFIKEAVILGVVGAIIGLAVLFGAWYYFITQIGTPFVQDSNQLIILVIAIFILGVVITVLSTIFATWKFLRSNVDDLYYS